MHIIGRRKTFALYRFASSSSLFTPVRKLSSLNLGESRLCLQSLYNDIDVRKLAD
jgi:hypothetical protein